MQLSDQEFIAKAEGYLAIMRAPADPSRSPEEIKGIAQEILAFYRLNNGSHILARSLAVKEAYYAFKKELYRQLYTVDSPRRGHAVH